MRAERARQARSAYLHRTAGGPPRLLTSHCQGYIVFRSTSGPLTRMLNRFGVRVLRHGLCFVLYTSLSRLVGRGWQHRPLLGWSTMSFGCRVGLSLPRHLLTTPHLRANALPTCGRKWLGTGSFWLTTIPFDCLGAGGDRQLFEEFFWAQVSYWISHRNSKCPQIVCGHFMSLCGLIAR